MSPAFKKMGKNAGSFGTILKSVLAAGFIQRGIGALTNGIRGVSQEFVNFDQSITAASAKFKGLDLTTKEGQTTLEALKNTAREVGAQTQFSATQAASGLDFLAMAGFNATQAMSALPGVVDLATVANVDLARATDIASDSLGAFGLMTDDATELQKRFTFMNDVMAKTMTSTNTSMEDLFESIKKGAPAFTAAGQKMTTFNALAGVMANSGVKGSESGTSLRNVMLRLAKPVGEAAKLMDSMGIKTADQHGNFRDVVDILADMEKGLVGMGTQQRTAALATIFGAKTVTGINILLGEGTDKIRAFREQLEAAGGSSQQMAAIMRQSLQNRIASLQSSLTELGFKFIDAFGPRIGTAIDGLTNISRKVNDFIGTNKDLISQGVDKFFSVVGKVLKTTGKLVSPIIDLGKALWSVVQVITKGLIPSGSGAFKIFERLVSIITIGIKILTVFVNAVRPIIAFLKPFIIIIGAVVLAIKAWIIVQGIINFLMTANPIGLIIVAIGVLIVAIIALVQNWDKVVVVLKNVWGWFMKLLDNPLIAAAGVIFAPFITIPALIIKHWIPIKDFFIGLWNIVKGFADFVQNNFLNMVDRVSSGIAKVKNFLGLGDSNVEVGQVEAPNRREAEARQMIQFQGQLNIAGAPEGSTLESNTTGAPPVRTELLGAAL
jgi:TP901 family phage tail tape measure protein